MKTGKESEPNHTELLNLVDRACGDVFKHKYAYNNAFSFAIS